MADEKNLFIPVFYSAKEITSSLSDGEFGLLIRELLASGGKMDYKPSLKPHLLMAYKFMLESANRVFGSYYGSSERSRGCKSSQRASNPAGEDDKDEAYERAFERSYGTKAN